MWCFSKYSKIIMIELNVKTKKVNIFKELKKIYPTDSWELVRYFGGCQYLVNIDGNVFLLYEANYTWHVSYPGSRFYPKANINPIKCFEGFLKDYNLHRLTKDNVKELLKDSNTCWDNIIVKYFLSQDALDELLSSNATYEVSYLISKQNITLDIYKKHCRKLPIDYLLTFRKFDFSDAFIQIIKDNNIKLTIEDLLVILFENNLSQKSVDYIFDGSDIDFNGGLYRNINFYCDNVKVKLISIDSRYYNNIKDPSEEVKNAYNLFNL